MGVLLSRCGHRGSWLVLLGTVWGVFGFGALLNPQPARSWALIEYLPPLVQASGWWITGAVAIAVGLRCLRDDSPGHVALYLLPALKITSYVVSTLVFVGTRAAHALDPTIPVQGWNAAWYAALVWALISVMLAHAAAWPDPRPALPEPPIEAGDDE